MFQLTLLTILERMFNFYWQGKFIPLFDVERRHVLITLCDLPMIPSTEFFAKWWKNCLKTFEVNWKILLATLE